MLMQKLDLSPKAAIALACSVRIKKLVFPVSLVNGDDEIFASQIY
jgi:hypothetical protein